MQIKRIDREEFSANTYIVQEGGDAFIIDSGTSSKPVFDYLSKNGLTPKAVLLTHGHYDHCQSASDFAKNGIKVYISKEDYDLIESGRAGAKILPFDADFYADGQELSLNGVKFKIIGTAGHTAGSVCIAAEQYLFTGDTLFFKSIGRTDFPSGNMEQMKNSLKKLCDLDFNYKILPGHERETELFFEKQNNRFLIELQ